MPGTFFCVSEPDYSKQIIRLPAPELEIDINKIMSGESVSELPIYYGERSKYSTTVERPSAEHDDVVPLVTRTARSYSTREQATSPRSPMQGSPEFTRSIIVDEAQSESGLRERRNSRQGTAIDFSLSRRSEPRRRGSRPDRYDDYDREYDRDYDEDDDRPYRRPLRYRDMQYDRYDRRPPRAHRYADDYDRRRRTMGEWDDRPQPPRKDYPRATEGGRGIANGDRLYLRWREREEAQSEVYVS